VAGHSVKIKGKEVKIRKDRFRDNLSQRLRKKDFYEDFMISGHEVTRILFEQGVLQQSFSNGSRVGDKWQVHFLSNKGSSQGFHYFPKLSGYMDDRLETMMGFSDNRKSLLVGGLGLLGLGIGLKTLAYLSAPGLQPISDGFLMMGGFTGALSELEKEVSARRLGGKEFKQYSEDLKKKKEDLLYWRLGPFSKIDFWCDVEKLLVDGKEFSPYR